VSPRRSAAAAAATRDTIVSETVTQASLEGLESVTIGKLAESLRMSKAGVVGHFGNKEGLQLAALDAGIATFTREVWEPAAAAKPGLARLTAITDSWLAYLERGVFPGGCLLTAAAAEYDGRSGPVRDAIEGAFSLWIAVLEGEASTAVEQGELAADTDPAQVAFELNAAAMAANQALQLRADGEAVARGRRAMRRALQLQPD
jgi:AcrR family transcriptional regulator